MPAVYKQWQCETDSLPQQPLKLPLSSDLRINLWLARKIYGRPSIHVSRWSTLLRPFAIVWSQCNVLPIRYSNIIRLTLSVNLFPESWLTDNNQSYWTLDCPNQWRRSWDLLLKKLNKLIEFLFAEKLSVNKMLVGCVYGAISTSRRAEWSKRQAPQAMNSWQKFVRIFRDGLKEHTMLSEMMHSYDIFIEQFSIVISNK